MTERERERWISFIHKMVEVYGVTSYLDNLEDTDFVDTDDLWFTCPECEEPILAADWDLDEVMDSCPVCGYVYGDYME